VERILDASTAIHRVGAPPLVDVAVETGDAIEDGRPVDRGGDQKRVLDDVVPVQQDDGTSETTAGREERVVDRPVRGAREDAEGRLVLQSFEEDEGVFLFCSCCAWQ